MRRRGAKVYCEVSKIKKHLFPTQEKAEQYMRNLILNSRKLEGGLPKRVYYCESCGGWHMTSKAHIMQKHIDDGSAVLNPAPIIIEQLPESFILYEDKMHNLRNFYNSWERKCKSIQDNIEKQQIMSAKVAIDKLVRYRVNKELYRSEKEYFTDWRKRLVEKTLLLQRRINNILEGNTRKNRPIVHAPVIKCRYVPIPPRIPNPMETIDELRRDINVLLENLYNPSFYSSILLEDGCYTDIRNSIKKTGRFIRGNEDEILMSIACFSVGSEPIKSLLDGYYDIKECIVKQIEFSIQEENTLAEARLRSVVDIINKRLNIVSQGQPDFYLWGVPIR